MVINKTNEMDIAFKRLQEEYPNAKSCKIAITELDSLLELPKGTTYYFSDIHGQGNKFVHIMHNKAGVIKKKIDDTLPELDEDAKIELSKLCFYPRAAMSYYQKNHSHDKYVEYIKEHALLISSLIQFTGSKITRKTFNENINTSEFSETIQELVSGANHDKIDSGQFLYQKQMIQSYIDNNIAEDLMEEMVRIFKQLLVYKYVINGDIPDRGADTAEIIDLLIQYDTIYENVEINWGNHDMLWMGAAAGSRELILDMLRIQLRYGFYQVIEDDYNISLEKLRDYAVKTYKKKPCAGFSIHGKVIGAKYSEDELEKMQKALAVMLWKIEARRAEELNIKSDLRAIYQDGAGNFGVEVNNQQYVLMDQDFPTIDVNNVEKFTIEECDLVESLRLQFKNSNRLQKHMGYLAQRGALYHFEDDILSYHAIVPLNEDGSLRHINILGKNYRGKELFDVLTSLYKSAFNMPNPPQQILDLFYQGWKGHNSWTYGKSTMETFTRALVNDKSTHTERKAVYYRILADSELAQKSIDNIIADFTGKPMPTVKIFNGHVPVKIKNGESAVKANGSLICGDGGFAEAYGDVGFCMISTSKGIYLKKLGPSVSQEEVMSKSKDIVPLILWKELYPRRKRLRDSSSASRIYEKINLLKKLVQYYESQSI